MCTLHRGDKPSQSWNLSVLVGFVNSMLWWLSVVARWMSTGFNTLAFPLALVKGAAVEALFNRAVCHVSSETQAAIQLS